MLANESQDAPAKLVVGNHAVKGLVNGMRVFGGRLIHATGSIDIVHEDQAAGFHQRQSVGQVCQRAFIGVIAVDQYDVD